MGKGSFWTTKGELMGGAPDGQVVHIDAERPLTPAERVILGEYLRDLDAPVRRGELRGELLVVKCQQAGLSLAQLSKVAAIPRDVLGHVAAGGAFDPSVEERVAELIEVRLVDATPDPGPAPSGTRG